MKHMKIMVRIHSGRPRGQIDGLGQAETGAKKNLSSFASTSVGPCFVALHIK